ncbi:MAG TPA: glucoamylase family protein, partial [Cyclobacteriaceae bacterium]|nr:glucoamylase family protein [Cyclobacteriaceae bacterium]
FTFFISCIAYLACSNEHPTPTVPDPFAIASIDVDGRPFAYTYSGTSLSPVTTIRFSEPIDHISAQTGITLSNVFGNITLTYSFTHHDSAVVVQPVATLNYLSAYTLTISTDVMSATKKNYGTSSIVRIITQLNPAPKLPAISDDQLLTKTQQQTFKYFWDLAHPASGMALERNTSGDLVTTGGSGFGLMALVVGIDRGFISRQDGIQRFARIVGFLEKADRFHGAWAHWINGVSGKVIPFSTKDDGGDLVESSFLIQGLLTVRQYLQPSDTAGNNLIRRITKLYDGVEWDWYRQNDSNVLYWHWSPNYQWQLNFALSGYFEEQVTYLLAAASSTHPIPKNVYTNGFAKNGSIVGNNTYYGYMLPIESPGPLFWVHYSYLGLNPHFSDDYANYWTQNVNASLINHAYCVANPKKWYGYSDECWGLTASDNQNGYAAHSPANDLGVIAPTAALSSFPYTPAESMKALKFFYYTLGDRLWGNYGFYDAFNLSEAWTANSYLAIDQGPIIVMIENYRTGLLWNLFMSAPEVQAGAQKLNFH